MADMRGQCSATDFQPFTAGLLTGTGAVFSASCCVLPLALGGLGAVASAFAVLEAISDYRHCDRERGIGRRLLCMP